MKCPACHEEYDDQMEYCPFCGNDNPKVDPVGDDISHEEQTIETNNAQIVELKIKPTEGDIRKLEFDLNNDYEKRIYFGLKELASSKKSYFWGIYACVVLMTILAVAAGFWNLVACIVIFIVEFVTVVVLVRKYNEASRNIAETQLGYARYSIEKKGGTIKSFDRYSLTMVYELNNIESRMSIKYKVMRPWQNMYD